MRLAKRVGAGEFEALYVASDAIELWIDEATAEDTPARRRSYLVVQDTNVTPLAQLADVVLAGATFAEKAGCYVNADGRLQYAEAALPPRDGVAAGPRPVRRSLLGRGAGPIALARRARRKSPRRSRRSRAAEGAKSPRSASSSVHRPRWRPVAAASVRRSLDADLAQASSAPKSQADRLDVRRKGTGFMTLLALLGILIKILVVVGITQGAVAYLIWVERKVAAYSQDRIGPNRCGHASSASPSACSSRWPTGPRCS